LNEINGCMIIKKLGWNPFINGMKRRCVLKYLHPPPYGVSNNMHYQQEFAWDVDMVDLKEA
jgi:hypothetical protein